MQKLPKEAPKIRISPKFYKNLPEGPGIYIFFHKDNVIYVGKAVNIKRRVASYFDLDLEPKTKRMVSEAESLSYIRVTSELEALLLEAKLIRKYMPRYNIAAKDDKHPLYIRVTKEEFPRVITARKIAENEPNIAFYGPFPSSTSVRGVLRMLRKIFPYCDHKIGKRACLYSHLGLCNPCPNEITGIKSFELRTRLEQKYKKNVRHIKAILDGKINYVRKTLEKEMAVYSVQENFEEAAKARDQIRRLEYITQPATSVESFMENPNLYQDIRSGELKELRNVITRRGMEVGALRRIECFDVAHLAGTNPTASMVTFVNGESEKKYYRHFKIRQAKAGSDVDSLREVIKRRLNHIKDWGEPDLIIVDGGKPQVGVFMRELESDAIPVVGLAKRFETLVIPVKSLGTVGLKEYRLPRGSALNLVQRLRDEAHRFARAYHHKLISRSFK